ncbi:sugar-transfer associated ATP-grasp domain-containing protein [Mariniphaga sp.]|uniref:sugar-transfer associated ATP-grasp domain-containing protein n=1 Tax=Mariniphaga sp. TaxID=1954475 RepID=UPI003569580A
MDRLLYFGYVVLTYIKHRNKLFEFSRCYKHKYKRPAFYFLFQTYMSFLKYSMHPMDYFYFDVYKNEVFNPNEYANTLFMYRFQKKLNNKKFTKYFYNKLLFNQKFRSFNNHDFLNIKTVSLQQLENWILKKNPNTLIIKKNNSAGGFGVKKINIEITKEGIRINNQPLNKYFNYLKKFDLLEEYVIQHEDIMKLNPSCLNTIRIVTVLNSKGTIDIIGAAIRLGVNNDLDNVHAGGIAVNVNIETGCLNGIGFRLNPSEKKYFEFHPVTNIKFDGYQLPHWDLLIETVKRAAMVIPEVRTVGWDVAITEKGISLIEGNHNWHKTLIEKALKKGIRKDLEKYI